jgi:DNA-binding Xre family transcriptional regulator
MTVREHIAYVLNKRIKEDKITSQANVAKALGVSESAISKMMKSGQVDLDNIMKLCNAIKVDANELIGFDINPEDRDCLDAIHLDDDLKAFVLSRKK